jgi:hypothetical protein
MTEKRTEERKEKIAIESEREIDRQAAQTVK